MQPFFLGAPVSQPQKNNDHNDNLFMPHDIAKIQSS